MLTLPYSSSTPRALHALALEPRSSIPKRQTSLGELGRRRAEIAGEGNPVWAAVYKRDYWLAIPEHVMVPWVDRAGLGGEVLLVEKAHLGPQGAMNDCYG